MLVSEAMELEILNIYLWLCTFSFSFITEKTRGKTMSLVGNFIWL